MPGDSQSLTFPGLYESPSNVNRSKFTEREAFMSNVQSLSHTKWECKYHLTWIPKYRRKELYGDLRKYLGEVLRELARRRECEILKGPPYARSRPYVYLHSSEVCRLAKKWLGSSKVKARFTLREKFFGRKEKFYSGKSFGQEGTM